MNARTHGTTRGGKRRISTLVRKLRAGFRRKPESKARSGPLGVLRILRPRAAAPQAHFASAVAR